MSTQRPQPLLRLDSVLGILQIEEALDGCQPVVPEFQSVPADSPRIDEGEVRREDRKLVIQQPCIEEGNVVVAAVVSQPHVSGQHPFGDVPEKSLLSLDQIIGFIHIVEDVENLNMAFSNDLGAEG
jgi:hypothetical protein